MYLFSLEGSRYIAYEISYLSEIRLLPRDPTRVVGQGRVAAMAQRTKPRVVSVGGTGLSGLWGVYATWTTASQLPEDAGGLAKMLADPPIYLPWLLLAGFIIFLGWSFWPERREPNTAGADEPGPVISGGSGAQENYIHSGTGHQIIKPGAVQFEQPKFDMTDELMLEIANRLRQAEPVVVAWKNEGRSPGLAARLLDFLKAKGFDARPLPFGQIPVRRTEAVTILPHGIRTGGMILADGHQAVIVDVAASI